MDSPVIFLDIDGVLNHNAPFNDDKEVLVEKCADVLSEIVKVTGAKIVLHSGRRRFLDADMNTEDKPMKWVIERLGARGLKIYGCTPDLSTPEIAEKQEFNKVKHLEIQAYVKENDITDYVILDDHHFEGEAARHSYKVNSRNGLQKSDIAGILAMFGRA